MKGAVFVDLNRKSKEKRILNNNLKAHINKEHLKLAEQTYLELRALYKFKMIECTCNNEMRTINDIHTEVSETVLEYLKQ